MQLSRREDFLVDLLGFTYERIVSTVCQTVELWEKVQDCRSSPGNGWDSFESELSKELIDGNYNSKFFILGIIGDLLSNMGNLA